MARSRAYLFQEAIAAVQRPLHTIVELGTIKSCHPKAEASYGYSTLAWIKTGAHVYSVDNNQRSIAQAREVIMQRAVIREQLRLNLVLQDGLEFLQGFGRLYELLYIDGPGRAGTIECVQEASSKMEIGSVLLFDDCDIDGDPPLDGRRRAVPVAEEFGFKLIQDSHRQCLLKKESHGG